jgi:streptogramin lyase
MQPIVHGLETEFTGRIAFERRNANTDTGKVTMEAYGLLAHPSFVIVAPDGTMLWSYMGPLSVDRLREQLNQFIR